MILFITINTQSIYANQASPLEQKIPLYFSTLEWPPYIGTRLPSQGFVAQLVREVFLYEGYSPHFHFFPWARAVKKGTEHNYSGYFPEYSDADCLISDSFPGGPVTLIVRTQSTITVSSLNNLDTDLKGVKIGVVKDYINHPSIDNSSVLKLEPTTSDETNLKKLLSGRIDVMIADPYTAFEIHKKLYPQAPLGFKVLLPILKEQTLHICFNPRLKESTKLRKVFNNGLKHLKESGRLAELQNLFSSQLPAEIRSRLHSKP